MEPGDRKEDWDDGSVHEGGEDDQQDVGVLVVDFEVGASVELDEAKKRLCLSFLDIVGPELLLVSHAPHMPKRIKQEEFDYGPTCIINHIVQDYVAHVREPERVKIGVNPVEKQMQESNVELSE